jgi:purine-binding chemotaxis protein CheW
MGRRGMKPETSRPEGTGGGGFVTVVTAGQLFGLPLDRVRDVFVPRGLSLVPLAPPEVTGLLNLRGRIVTAIDLRRRLGLPALAEGISIAIGIEERGELYGLIVDRVGDVLTLDRTTYEPNPVNLDQRWAQVCAGVHRLEHELMVVLDVDKVLDLGRYGAVA